MDYRKTRKKLAKRYNFKEERVREEMKIITKFSKERPDLKITMQDCIDYVIRTLISESQQKEKNHE